MIPGAQLVNITNLADVEISALGKSDAVIVIGGANDINKNKTNIGLTHLQKFIENRRNTNIMVVTASHRYDLHESSCVNNEIVVFSRKLHKLVKTADSVNIVQATLNRNDFTRHGMHLHISGKEKVAKLIGESLKKLISRKEETPFTLKWKNELKDPHQEKTVVKPTCDVIKEPNLKATGLLELYEETQDQFGKPPPTSTTDHNNAPSRTSNRIKKIPSTMNEDFLWITGPLTRVHQQPV